MFDIFKKADLGTTLQGIGTDAGIGALSGAGLMGAANLLGPKEDPNNPTIKKRSLLKSMLLGGALGGAFGGGARAVGDYINPTWAEDTRVIPMAATRIPHPTYKEPEVLSALAYSPPLSGVGAGLGVNWGVKKLNTGRINYHTQQADKLLRDRNPGEKLPEVEQGEKLLQEGKQGEKLLQTSEKWHPHGFWNPGRLGAAAGVGTWGLAQLARHGETRQAMWDSVNTSKAALAAAMNRAGIQQN